MDTNNLMPITIAVLCLLLIHVVPVVRSQANQQYSNCSQSFRCANFNNLTYPFWGQNRPAYCGHPSFRLTCTGNSPLLTITNMQYRVLAIDNSNQILTVARQDLYNNSCPDSFRNTTLNFNFFDYQPGFQNLALYYGCSSNQSIRNQFECAGNMTRRTGYFVPANSSWFNSSCDVSISVPVNQTYAAALSSASATVSDLRQAIDSGFGLTWRSNDGECDRCVQSGGRCGHNTTSNSTSDSFICFCSDRPYQLVCGTGTRTGRNNIGRSLAIGLSVSAVGTMIIALAIFSYFRRQSSSFRAMAYWKHKNTSDQDIEDLIKSYGSLAPKRYNFSEIKKMTNSFSEKLGQGGFGSVFKGNLPDGHLVAVKILSEMKGNGEEFINEVASISRTSHVNVVTLLGFCYKGTKRALIYEFMPNGSLDKFICNDGPQDKNPPLQWKTLYEISVGIARGLDYLHRGCNTRIVHFDIKPQNILLDQDFCPKIADFGLAKLCQRKESILSMLDARGTIGYIAPEVFLRNLGGVSHKSDVYSYGMMVLEMAGAKNKNNFAGGSTTTSETYFPDWIYKYIEFGGNLRVEGVEIEEDQEETVKKMILVSLWCIQTNPSDRPSISKVLEMLEGSLQSLQIPPRPLFSPKNSFRETSTFFSEDFP